MAIESHDRSTVDIERLIVEYGNSMFECGNYNSYSSEKYEELRHKAKTAKRKLIDAIKKNSTT